MYYGSSRLEESTSKLSEQQDLISSFHGYMVVVRELMTRDKYIVYINFIWSYSGHLFDVNNRKSQPTFVIVLVMPHGPRYSGV